MMSTTSVCLLVPGWHLQLEQQGVFDLERWSQLKWSGHLALFFTSMLFHLTTASFCYFFSLPIVWGATVKESQNLTCFEVRQGNH
jgi:hypothetical protein